MFLKQLVDQTETVKLTFAAVVLDYMKKNNFIGKDTEVLEPFKKSGEPMRVDSLKCPGCALLPYQCWPGRVAKGFSSSLLGGSGPPLLPSSRWRARQRDALLFQSGCRRRFRAGVQGNGRIEQLRQNNLIESPNPKAVLYCPLKWLPLADHRD